MIDFCQGSPYKVSKDYSNFEENELMLQMVTEKICYSEVCNLYYLKKGFIA